MIKKDSSGNLSLPENLLTDCTLCPRNCHVNRMAGQIGYCLQTGTLRAARAALHYWEEPCISGTAGSGAVFFSGCSMRCAFCQNHDIAAGKAGHYFLPWYRRIRPLEGCAVQKAQPERKAVLRLPRLGGKQCIFFPVEKNFAWHVL